MILGVRETAAETTEERLGSGDPRATGDKLRGGMVGRAYDPKKLEAVIAADPPDIWLRTIADVTHPATVAGRQRKLPLVGTIIHATRGCGVAGALNEVKKGTKTWHFTVAPDGKIYQHVALNRSAGHAGNAVLRLPGAGVTKKLNDQTIGIELVNLGALVPATDKRGRPAWKVWIPPKNGKPATASENTVRVRGRPVPGAIEVKPGEGVEVWWEPFPAAQIDGLIELLRTFQNVGFGSALGIIRGHEQVARPRGRKIDPGQAFPWARVRSQFLIKR